MPVVPVLVDPVLVDPVLVDPVFVPSDVVSVGLAPPDTGGLDFGDAGVEEPLPGVDEDSVVLGLADLDGAAVGVAQPVGAAGADALRPALVLAFAEAVELALPLAVTVVVAVVVVVSLGPVPRLTVLPPDPLSEPLPGGTLAGLLAGVPLGVCDLAGLADLAGVAAAEEEEPDGHAVGGWLLRPAGVLP